MAKTKSSAKSVRRILNVVPSKNVELDWKYDVAIQSAAVAAIKAPPPSKDLRTAWWAVGDQENTGSCVGWASTDGVMRYHLVMAGKLQQKERLSPRCTWMASKETDQFTTRPGTFIEESGTSLKAAMDICRKFGTVLESMLPFQIDTTMYAGKEDEFYAAAAQRKCSSYFNLRKNFTQWRHWLATNGPLMVALSVDQTWYDATANKGLLDVYKPNTAGGGHAVCVVGYTKEGRFIIRNSWGTTWGDKGFAYATEAYITAAFFDESYGVTI
jgi:C1A family cysteine protease